MVLVSWVALAVSPASAAPGPSLGAGTRALTLEIDRASGRATIGDHTDQLATPVLTATVVAGQVVFGLELGTQARGPTRWAIKLAHTNRAGVTVARDLPILGHGIPPVAVAAPSAPPGLHLRAELDVDFGRFDGAVSAPVFVPALPEPLPARASVATLSIDGRDARLPIEHPRVTFDLDVPATVTLRVEDEGGTRWMRRAISATRVARPARRATVSPVVLDRDARALRVASAVVPLVAAGSRVVAAGIDDREAWVRLARETHDGVAWRAVFGGPSGARAVRFGVGLPPEWVSVPREGRALTWVEVEQSHRRGTRYVSARAPLAGPGPVEASALEWTIPSGSVAGQVVRVGTSTGARLWVLVPEDL